MPIYAVDGLTRPAGGASIATAVATAAPGITAPSGGFLTADPIGFVDEIDAWFKWTAPADGEVIFSSIYSYEVATDLSIDTVNLTVFTSHVGPDPTMLTDLTRVGGLSGTTKTITAVAGTTYWIGLWDFVAEGVDGLILCVSDYGAKTAWIDGSPTAWVARPPVSGSGAPNHTPDTVPSLGHGYDGFTLGTGFHGAYELNHSFNGNYPVDDSAAHVCAWAHARKGAYGGNWWSLAPTGANPASWNNTDPYNSGIPGSGTCLPLPGDIDSPSADEERIGVLGSSSAIDVGPGGGYQILGYDTYAATLRLSLAVLLSQFGPSAGAANPTDDPYSGGTLIWESPRPALLGLDVAPDERSDAHSGDLAVAWRLGTTDEDGGGGWGPTIAADATEGFGGGESPENFLARAGVALSYPSTGGLASWTAVPDDIITAGLTDAAASDVPTFFPGLRAVGLSGVDQSSVPPAADPATYSDFPQDYRDHQFLALRTHLQPARHRWQALPVLPLVEVLVPTGDAGAVRRRFLG